MKNLDHFVSPKFLCNVEVILLPFLRQQKYYLIYKNLMYILNIYIYIYENLNLVTSFVIYCYMNY